MQPQEDSPSLPHVTVHTDGGCDPNPGPGGWAAILHFDNGAVWTLWGNDPHTTNNRMELQAALAALALLEHTLGTCEIDLYTDSRYLQRGMTEWAARWEENNWQMPNGEERKNRDLWERLIHLTTVHRIRWHWLKGHQGHPLNEQADHLASEARRKLPTAPSTSTDKTLSTVEIYLKASYNTTRDVGGWGALLIHGDHRKTLSGQVQGASANAALLIGAIEALRTLKRPCRIQFYTDAKYLLHGATQWLPNWTSHGWKTKTGNEVANRTLWEELQQEMSRHQILWQEPPADENLAEVTQIALEARRRAEQEA